MNRVNDEAGTTSLLYCGALYVSGKLVFHPYDLAYRVNGQLYPVADADFVTLEHSPPFGRLAPHIIPEFILIVRHVEREQPLALVALNDGTSTAVTLPFIPHIGNPGNIREVIDSVNVGQVRSIQKVKADPDPVRVTFVLAQCASREQRVPGHVLPMVRCNVGMTYIF